LLAASRICEKLGVVDSAFVDSVYFYLCFEPLDALALFPKAELQIGVLGSRSIHSQSMLFPPIPIPLIHSAVLPVVDAVTVLLVVEVFT